MESGVSQKLEGVQRWLWSTMYTYNDAIQFFSKGSSPCLSSLVLGSSPFFSNKPKGSSLVLFLKIQVGFSLSGSFHKD